jgi:hypothetical protein
VKNLSSKPKLSLVDLFLVAALSLVAMFVFGPTACAQSASSIASFETRTLLAGGTNNVAASSTVTNGIVGGTISAGRHDVIGLYIYQKPAATNLTANVVYSFAKAISATEWESTPSVTVTMASNTNALPNASFTKVDVAGASALKLVSIANAVSVPITNITIKALLKAPGAYQFTR